MCKWCHRILKKPVLRIHQWPLQSKGYWLIPNLRKHICFHLEKTHRVSLGGYWEHTYVPKYSWWGVELLLWLNNCLLSETIILDWPFGCTYCKTTALFRKYDLLGFFFSTFLLVLSHTFLSSLPLLEQPCSFFFLLLPFRGLLLGPACKDQRALLSPRGADGVSMSRYLHWSRNKNLARIPLFYTVTSQPCRMLISNRTFLNQITTAYFFQYVPNLVT